MIIFCLWLLALINDLVVAFPSPSFTPNQKVGLGIAAGIAIGIGISNYYHRSCRKAKKVKKSKRRSSDSKPPDSTTIGSRQGSSVAGLEEESIKMTPFSPPSRVNTKSKQRSGSRGSFQLPNNVSFVQLNRECEELLGSPNPKTVRIFTEKTQEGEEDSKSESSYVDLIKTGWGENLPLTQPQIYLTHRMKDARVSVETQIKELGNLVTALEDSQCDEVSIKSKFEITIHNLINLIDFHVCRFMKQERLYGETWQGYLSLQQTALELLRKRSAALKFCVDSRFATRLSHLESRLKEISFIR